MQLALVVSSNRGQVIFKSLIYFFACTVTRAVHLEVVENLTTKDFIDALFHFVLRRGLCRNVNSVGGSNFVGADGELRLAFEFLRKNSCEFESSLAKSGISRSFIPPRAPPFRRSLGAVVKSFKTHFRCVLGTQVLLFSELSTLTCQIEAVLNAHHPLCTTAENSSTVLTPAHLCIGRSTLALPEVPCDVIKSIHRLYLLSLRVGYYKKVGRRQAKVDDVVLVMDENLVPSSWPLGRIVRTICGQDGVCRVADVHFNPAVHASKIITQKHA